MKTADFFMGERSKFTEIESADFVVQITEVQRDLYAYIVTLLPRAADVDDVLQEANRILWMKRDEYQPGTNFRAWAYTIARLQVLAQRKRHQQDRLLFDEQLLETMSSELPDLLEQRHPLRSSLAACMEKLSTKDAELLAQRYDRGLSMGQIAKHVQRSAGAIRQALFRIRHTLLECLERQTRVEGDV
jgi:RNA polymerase sigma-70 factor (ECF subfamily)